VSDVLYVVDVSHNKAYLPVAQLIAEGYSGLIAKATEGGSFVDPTYAQYYADARAHGVPFAAFHFVHHDVSTAAQLANIQHTVDRSVPIALDVEAEASLGNTPTAGDAHALQAALTAAGYRVFLSYFPHWYWVDQGEPALSGLAPLWASQYVAGRGAASALYQSVPAAAWAGYGGLDVPLLQFTDQAQINGAKYDVSAFRGTVDQLRSLFSTEDDVNLTDPITPTNGTATLPPTTVGEAIGRILFELTYPIATRATINADPKQADTMLGRAADADGHSYDAVQLLRAQGAQIAALQAAVTAMANSQHALTVDEMTAIVDQAVAQHVQITGNLQVGPAPTGPTAAAAPAVLPSTVSQPAIAQRPATAVAANTPPAGSAPAADSTTTAPAETTPAQNAAEQANATAPAPVATEPAAASGPVPAAAPTPPTT
jgi:GH25 family lysozyme M1 (1,4-beta-N-acetylmuramidase)